MAEQGLTGRRRALFFDRDGVLNALIPDGTPTGRSPQSVDELHLLDFSAEAVRLAHQSGFVPLIVTNQPGLGRGTLEVEALIAIHAALRRALPEVESVYVCPHTGSSCECRKPRPGLLFQAAEEWGIDLRKSWVVGDRWVDVATARAAGSQAALIEMPYSWLPNSDGEASADLGATITASDVFDAVRQIVAEPQN
jgi:D-glycero-D-manno-heptose 1,7-bisphosphate phosphatase